jgi:hypothetical protein
MHTGGTSQADYEKSMNLVFDNCNKKDTVYLLNVSKITESQTIDVTIR